MVLSLLLPACSLPHPTEPNAYPQPQPPTHEDQQLLDCTFFSSTIINMSYPYSRRSHSSPRGPFLYGDYDARVFADRFGTPPSSRRNSSHRRAYNGSLEPRRRSPYVPRPHFPIPNAGSPRDARPSQVNNNQEPSAADSDANFDAEVAFTEYLFLRVGWTANQNAGHGLSLSDTAQDSYSATDTRHFPDHIRQHRCFWEAKFAADSIRGHPAGYSHVQYIRDKLRGLCTEIVQSRRNISEQGRRTSTLDRRHSFTEAPVDDRQRCPRHADYAPGSGRCTCGTRSGAARRGSVGSDRRSQRTRLPSTRSRGLDTSCVAM
ncbi:uncharacterized protein K460DRAFT_64317 [Cucurbitaria berberidis CBS 394.84]|uniref:Uncharacterized protein n=1 Tax=Cucurbitaria berberidis CBS 394.84 TaxID=1168544 RepID=A0A9P4GM99_9PLEO|nr:uncharacterized protein K460DRAFT_64317 [Cucurbitaria berberidis CBS 394.84]KAF1847812.1 hypothetical protein K460DRAFT_64317 [Cucurbitaria berberidis CBS 394.84]